MLDEYTLLVIKTAANEAAAAAVAAHKKECPIGTVKTELYGTVERPEIGLKHRVWLLEQCRRQLGWAGGLIRQILAPVISSLLISAAMLWLGFKALENKTQAAGGPKPNPPSRQQAERTRNINQENIQ